MGKSSYWDKILKLEFARIQPTVLDISEPPCKFCRFFLPRGHRDTGVSAEIVCCHSEDMFNDFSCFEQSSDRKPE